MYKKTLATKTTLNINNATEGESIETKVQRMTQNREPITDGGPPIYTDREDGVIPATNIRTDKWEHMQDAMSEATNAALGAREQRIGERAMKNMSIEEKTEYLKANPHIKDPSGGPKQ